MNATRPPWPFPASTSVPPGEPTPPVDATTISSRPEETLPPGHDAPSSPSPRGNATAPTKEIGEKRRARDGAPDGLVWDGKAEPAANRGGGDTSSPSGREYAGGTRGAQAGVNQEQMDAVSGVPPGPSGRPVPTDSKQTR